MSELNNCVECNEEFSASELVKIKGKLVCAGCKPILLQKVDESLNANDEFTTASVGIRFGALLIDSFVGFLVGLGLGLVLQETMSQIGGQFFGLAYYAFFVGKYGATPGKMLCKIKIIRMDGSDVGYGIGVGRYFAQLLSGLILCIGYLMAFFDKEYAQALHDKICKTRVVVVKK